MIAALCTGRFGSMCLTSQDGGDQSSKRNRSWIFALRTRRSCNPSLGVGILFGTAGLPHILMRFFTVSDEESGACIGLLRDVSHWPVLCDAVRQLDMAASQSSVAMPPMPAQRRAVWRKQSGSHPFGEGRWWKPPGGLHLGGCVRDDPGRCLGLLIAGASLAANDLVVGLSGRQLDERMRLWISRIAAMALGVLGILLGLACEGAECRLPPCARHGRSQPAPTFHCCFWQFTGTA